MFKKLFILSLVFLSFCSSPDNPDSDMLACPAPSPTISPSIPVPETNDERSKEEWVKE
jgi:hypothetical protein